MTERAPKDKPYGRAELQRLLTFGHVVVLSSEFGGGGHVVMSMRDDRLDAAHIMAEDEIEPILAGPGTLRYEHIQRVTDTIWTAERVIAGLSNLYKVPKISKMIEAEVPKLVVDFNAFKANLQP